MTEYQEQAKIFQWAKLNLKQHPVLMFLHSDMSGVRLSAKHAALSKRIQMNRGFPDISLIYNNGEYSALFIELKVKGGRVSPQQRDYLQWLEKQGCKAVVCVGGDDAIEVIKDYITHTSGLQNCP